MPYFCRSRRRQQTGTARRMCRAAEHDRETGQTEIPRLRPFTLGLDLCEPRKTFIW